MAKKPATKKKAKGVHPLTVGSYCTVRAGTSVHGRAKIVEHEDGDNVYTVRLDNDKSRLFTHTVLPEHAET